MFTYLHTNIGMKLIVLLCLIISVLRVCCMEIEQDCDSKWDVDYLNTLVVKNIIIIDMMYPQDSNETDCFYKYIQKRNVSLIVLDDKNINKENKNDIHIKLKYRSDDLAFIVLLPFPDIAWMLDREHWRLFRWHTRATVEIVIYKMEIIPDKNYKLIKEFLNQVIVELKLIEVVVIVLKPKQVFFTYDQDSMSQSKSLACDLIYSEQPLNHTYLNENSHKMRENYPVHIATFYRPPSAMFMHEMSDMVNALSKGSNGIGGKDGLLIADIVNKLKFAPVYYTPDGTEPYGVVFDNGTITGVLKDIVEGKADLSGNSRFLTAYGAEDDYYFLAYSNFDRLCIIVRKSDLIPVWVHIAQTYSLLIWSLIFIQTASIALIRWAHYKIVMQRESCIIDLVIQTFFSYIVPVTKVQNASQKIFVLGNLLIIIILVPILQGNIRSSFTKRKHYPDKDTLEEIDKEFNKIYAPLIDKNLIFGKGSSALYDRLNSKVDSTAYAFEVIVEDLIDKNLALVLPESDFKEMSSVKVTEMVGQLHIAKECPRLYLYSFICSIDFPWISDVEMTTYRLVEAGLAQWYFEMTLYDQIVQDKPVNSTDPESAYIMDLGDMDGPFYLYFIGLLISTAMFVLEYFEHPTSL